MAARLMIRFNKEIRNKRQTCLKPPLVKIQDHLECIPVLRTLLKHGAENKESLFSRCCSSPDIRSWCWLRRGPPAAVFAAIHHHCCLNQYPFNGELCCIRSNSRIYYWLPRYNHYKTLLTTSNYRPAISFCLDFSPSSPTADGQFVMIQY